MISTCPHCGQRMLLRHGVPLPPRKAEILDMIEDISKRGKDARISSEVLAWIFCPGMARQQGIRLMAVHINQLNGLLAHTNVVIDCKYREGYRVSTNKWKAPTPALA